jgi:hypothetical protein
MRIEKPNRASRTYVQKIQGPIEKVFPLYCPVRESEWVPGWDPIVVFSESGVVEPDCVFMTKADGTEAIWLVTQVDQSKGFVEMVKVVPGSTVCKLQIKATAVSEQETSAEITYCQTSLGPEGDRAVEEFTETYYKAFMKEWENFMNHFLETGKLLGS